LIAGKPDVRALAERVGRDADGEAGRWIRDALFAGGKQTIEAAGSAAGEEGEEVSGLGDGLPQGGHTGARLFETAEGLAGFEGIRLA